MFANYLKETFEKPYEFDTKAFKMNSRTLFCTEVQFTAIEKLFPFREK